MPMAPGEGVMVIRRVSGQVSRDARIKRGYLGRLEKMQPGEGLQDVDLGGVLAEEFYGADAVGVECVVDVVGEVVTYGLGEEREARGPLADDVFNVGEAVIAREGEVFGELGGCDVGDRESVRSHRPDGGDPRETCAGPPLVREVEPVAGTHGFFELRADIEGDESGVSDEYGCIGLLEHSDGVGVAGNEGWLDGEELAEEDFGVGKGAARCLVCGNSSDGFECACWVAAGGLNDELDGAHVVE